jgi:hypothetical protein
MPNNLRHLRETIDSLVAQELPADAIYVNLPKRNARTGDPYPPPPAWFEEQRYKDAGLRTNLLSRDYGPLTKLVGALLEEQDPATMVITVDDDKVYAPNLLRKLAWHSHNDPETAFGPCGWSFLPMPPPRGITPVYTPWALRGEGRYLDELQACCGIAYRVGHFRNARDPDLSVLTDPVEACFTTDDLWIASVLALVHDRPRVLVGGSRWGLDPSTAAWKSGGGDSDARFALSIGNGRAGVDVGCVRAAEERHGRAWPVVAEHDRGVYAGSGGGPGRRGAAAGGGLRGGA